MLADQRLGDPERVDEFVHAARFFAQLQHDGDAHRCGQGPQQIARGVENGARRQLRRRCAGVVVGRRRVGDTGNGFH